MDQRNFKNNSANSTLKAFDANDIHGTTPEKNIASNDVLHRWLVKSVSHSQECKWILFVCWYVWFGPWERWCRWWKCVYKKTCPSDVLFMRVFLASAETLNPHLSAVYSYSCIYCLYVFFYRLHSMDSQILSLPFSLPSSYLYIQKIPKICLAFCVSISSVGPGVSVCRSLGSNAFSIFYWYCCNLTTDINICSCKS